MNSDVNSPLNRDPSPLVEALYGEAGPSLRVVVEYDAQAYAIEYVAPDVAETYGSTDAIVERTDSVHDFIAVDLTERRLFDRIVPELGSPTASTLHLENGALIRYVHPEREVGVCVSVDRDAPVAEIVACLEWYFEAGPSAPAEADTRSRDGRGG